ncbi:hypothetical protein WJX73_001741 [Symbiochloris irregularis]|uniref:Uncharacterized protein n=1 Tax=Symbiochloris irregularis TaxID=706552 RepID=A0AAW1NMT4_9CHLO
MQQMSNCWASRRSRWRCPTGEARITGAAKLQAKYVIHTVGPVYYAHAPEKAAELLSSSYRNCLQLANENKCRSIAFPAISCGLFGYPFSDAAEVALQACREHAGNLLHIEFVFFSTATGTPFLDLARTMFKDSSTADTTWIIPPEDLHYKMSNGTPVLLGKGGFGSVYLGVLNQFLGVCVQGSQLCLVMQHMSGGDLWSKLENDETGEYQWYRKGRGIALDVAKGLVFLHSKRIAHLDLKTPNILLSNSDEAKISDVGLGKLISGPGMIATQAGSFYWASPEQLLGQATTTMSDMFSMGTVLWEICTGEQPRQRRLRQLRVPEEAPQAVADLIQRCFVLEPSDRPTAVALHNTIACSTIFFEQRVKVASTSWRACTRNTDSLGLDLATSARKITKLTTWPTH